MNTNMNTTQKQNFKNVIFIQDKYNDNDGNYSFVYTMESNSIRREKYMFQATEFGEIKKYEAQSDMFVLNNKQQILDILKEYISKCFADLGTYTLTANDFLGYSNNNVIPCTVKRSRKIKGDALLLRTYNTYFNGRPTPKCVVMDSDGHEYNISANCAYVSFEHIKKELIDNGYDTYILLKYPLKTNNNLNIEAIGNKIYNFVAIYNSVLKA